MEVYKAYHTPCSRSRSRSLSLSLSLPFFHFLPISVFKKEGHWYVAFFVSFGRSSWRVGNFEKSRHRFLRNPMEKDETNPEQAFDFSSCSCLRILRVYSSGSGVFQTIWHTLALHRWEGERQQAQSKAPIYRPILVLQMDAESTWDAQNATWAHLGCPECCKVVWNSAGPHAAMICTQFSSKLVPPGRSSAFLKTFTASHGRPDW